MKFDKNSLLKIVRERYDDGYSADQDQRTEMQSDLRFVAGDHWPESVRLERESDNRPVVTENHLPQFVRQVVGDGRMNRPAIKVLPGGGEASQEKAEIFAGMIRNIEAEADTYRPYLTALASAARCSIGHWRILTDYVSPTSFEQCIKLRPIHNPFAVIWDPVAKAITREDADWCFVCEELSEDEFAQTYPNAKAVDFDNKDAESWSSRWMDGSKKTVLIAEYWWKETEPKKLVQFMIPPEAAPRTAFEDEVPENVIVIAERMSERTTVYSLKTNGIEILEEPKEFAVPMIPIVPVIGEEFAVGDKKIRHSVIRFAKEPQQLYNYWLSTQTEHLALQPKAPFIATAKMVSRYQDVWKTANTANHAVLVYDPDDQAPGARPQREQPPASSPAHSEQVLRARDAMKATTGIYDAGLGNQSNETSGRAIMARQRESDVGTSEFLDNLAASVAYTGKILLKLIPKIYDTPRIVRILGEDGAEDFKQINQPYLNEMTGEVEEFDLRLGEFEAQVSTGPSFTTRRQEAAESMLAFVQTAPQSAQFVMDLIAKNMDWPGADEFAARFRKALPPNMQPSPSTPEEQAERQQAEQAAAEAADIQKRGAMAQVAKTEADAADKQAEANKTELEAQQLALELMLQNGALERIVQEQVQAALAAFVPVQAPVFGGYQQQ